jgi:hypothetical protein
MAARLAAIVVSLTLLVGVDHAAGQWPTPNLEDEPGTIKAAFGARSYAPGGHAVLRVWADGRPFSLQILHVGLERARPKRDDLLEGTPVSSRRVVVPARPGVMRIAVPIGSWRSGFYFARLSRSNGDVGFAPFVLRADRLGKSRVLIVLPTHTWQAYNFRDADNDGVGDTWYASPRGRAHHGHLRPRPVRRDDLLRDSAWREGLRRRGHELRWRGGVAAHDAAHGEPLETSLQALARRVVHRDRGRR